MRNLFRHLGPDEDVSTVVLANVCGVTVDRVVLEMQKARGYGIIGNPIFISAGPPPLYFLSRRDAEVVAARLSPEIGSELVRAGRERRNHPGDLSGMLLNDPKALLSLLTTSVSQIVAQSEQLKLQAPKVAAADRFLDCGERVGLREGARLLGLRQGELVLLLLSERWAYKEQGRSGALKPYHYKVPHHLDTRMEAINGTFRACFLITPEGLSGLLPLAAARPRGYET